MIEPQIGILGALAGYLFGHVAPKAEAKEDDAKAGGQKAEGH